MVHSPAPRAPKKRYKKVFYIDSANEHRWRILSSNGRILADSGEGYKRAADCKQSLERIFKAGYDVIVMGAHHHVGG